MPPGSVRAIWAKLGTTGAGLVSYVGHVGGGTVVTSSGAMDSAKVGAMKDGDAKRVLSADAVTHFEFERVPLRFDGGAHSDVFAEKNNKTLEQTLVHRRYARLARLVLPKYASCLARPLGKFLCELKCNGDDGYLRFLNKYGDLTYSTFAIAHEGSLGAKGVYAYWVDEELKYIGRCRDSMRKRVNQGHGKIHPKNCYLDGQATNCHLNALITQARNSVSLWLCAIASDEEIERTELQLLRRYSPPWNIQRP